MFIPSGCKLTYSDLAGKFGWGSVVASFVLFPVTFTFRHLFAFPFWMGLLPRNPVVFAKTIFQHPSHPDFMRRHLYTNRKAVTPPLSPFNILCDDEGGYWFEYFWGLIHCLKCEVHEDQYILSPTYASFLPAYCTIDYDKDKKDTVLRIVLPNKWASFLNPFALGTIAWCVSALQLFNTKYFEGYKKKHGVITIDTPLPKDEKAKNKYL